MVSKKNSIAIDVDEICLKLSKLHYPYGWKEVSRFLELKFGSDLSMRAKFFNAIMYAQQPFKYDPKISVQKFHVLQGDVITTTLANVPEPLLPYDE